MKTRVDMLTHDELNKVTRPYRIIGSIAGPYDGYVSIEYLDVYEYDWHPLWQFDAVKWLSEGWGIYNIYTDADNEPTYILRRIKPEE